MEIWLILALVCSVLASLAGFFDNSIVDNYFTKKPHVQKCFFGPVYAIIAIVIFCFYIFSGTIPSIQSSSAFLIILSGAFLSLSSIPYYFALKSENTTGAVIFCQLEPIFLLILGSVFLEQTISLGQLIAFFILLSAPILIILSTRKRGKKLEYKAALLILLHIFIYSISYIIFLVAKKDSGTFETGMPIAIAIAFLLSGRAIFDIILIFVFKNWRKEYNRILKKSKNKAIIPLLSSSALWISEDAILRVAMTLGPIAIVSAVQEVGKLLLTFLLGIVFTIIWPKFGRESLNRKIIIIHFIATIIAIFGVILVENPEVLGL